MKSFDQAGESVNNQNTNLRRLIVVAIGIAMCGLLGIAARDKNLLIHIKTYLIPYCLVFVLMIVAFLLLRQFGKWEWRVMLLFAILFRIVMIIAPPTLSDDINRYAWYGKMSAHGINPYVYRPDAPELTSLRDTVIYPKMSSAAVYSVYPPVSQGVFFLGALTGHPIRAIKVIYSIFDLGTIIILWMLIGHFGLPRRNILLYAWNPLPVFEFAGSGHTDAALIFFTLLAIYCFLRTKYVGSFAALGFAIISKLLPLIFLPFFFFGVSGRKKYALAALSGLVVVLGYLPFAGALPTVIKNFRTDVGVYLNSNLYIFNGSLFTLFYWIRDRFHIYRSITDFGVMTQTLSIIFLFIWVGMVAWSWYDRKNRDGLRIAKLVMLTFFAFMVCSPNVQVWYVTWVTCFVPLFVVPDYIKFGPGFFGSLVRARLSWLTWSFTASFAYLAYYWFFKSQSYLVPVWAIWLEYGLLFGLLIIETVWRKRYGREYKAVAANEVKPA
jgi:alpha-1,6-mannosyltransferase